MQREIKYCSRTCRLYWACIGFGFLVFCGFGCEKEVLTEEVEIDVQPYSFFIAGHTYGRITENNDGLFPLFKNKFDLLNEDSLIQFGVLTGDMVRYCTNQDWDEVDRDLTLLNMPVYFAAGNHDVADRELYEGRYGQTYYSFDVGNDLFIVLDPGLDDWNISDEQLDFLIDEVQEAGGERIFIIFHQLLWWSPDNLFQKVLPNSINDRDEDLNFWSQIEPFLRRRSQDIYLLAGDIGIQPGVIGYFFYQYENLTLAASGMGVGPTDNFVIVDVLPNGQVDFRLIALWGDDINALGDLEDFELR